MKTRFALAIISACALGAPACIQASERMTERTLKLSPGEKSPPATIADMKWLAGRWIGEDSGGTSEEWWAEPAGKSMSGMYRMHKNGKVVFYELMNVAESDGSLVFRLKHFNADLTGWEEKNEVRSFPLVAKRDGALLFEGMSFHPQGDRLTIHLAIEQKDKSATEMTFNYRRVAP